MVLPQDFSAEAREAVYAAISKRRDVRHFRPGIPLPEDVLERILGAAHQAPSVGYSQPWDFVVVRDAARRSRIRENFLRCREAEAARFAPERREKYLAYRLEGIEESSLNLCVTVDLRPAEEVVLGTTAQPEALRWSACCAVQNLWLAARAEGVGVGWVSIVEPRVLRAELGLPPGIEPVAYLCVGYPVVFGERPLLEETGWRARRPLSSAVHDERFRAEATAHGDAQVAGSRWQPASDAGCVVGAGPARDTAVEPLLTAASSAPAVPLPRKLEAVPAFDTEAEARSQARQLRLTKPAGSLGRLEALAGWYAGVRGQHPAPPPRRARLYVFAADHGVVQEGVSAFSSALTAAMVGNLLAGGAAANALARANNVELTVVDVGVAGDLSALPTERVVPFVSAPVRAGTGNLRREPALSVDEARAALATGERLAREAAREGVDVLVAGELGIGNTTVASALTCALTGLSPEDAVGAGTGLDAAGIQRKADVVRDALALHASRLGTPLEALAAVGGLELAAMAGLMLGGARERRPVVVDGFIASAAALLAVRLEPAVRPYLLFSHCSAERGHRALLAALEARPLFDLGLRLGEGTGAVLAVPLLRAACEAEAGMATFATAGITDRLRSGT